MLFVSDGTDNYGHYSNSDVDADAQKLETTFDTSERDAIVKDLTQKVVDDFPDAFIASQQLLIVYNNKVTGVDVNPSEYYLITNTLDIAE